MSKIDNNTTALQELLEAVNALPEGGGSGGASVETCTVKLTAYVGYALIMATVLKDDGSIGNYVEIGTGSTDTTIANVVCNTLVIIVSNNDTVSEVTNATRVTTTDCRAYEITAPAGGTATIFSHPV